VTLLQAYVLFGLPLAAFAIAGWAFWLDGGSRGGTPAE
jgi:hypothetical protein